MTVEKHIIAEHTVISEELQNLPTEEARARAIMKAWQDGRMKQIAPAMYEMLPAQLAP